MLTWSAADITATASLNRALRAVGISRQEWDNSTEAEKLVLLGHGDEPVSVRLGEGQPVTVILADGRELVTPASCGCDEQPSNADLRRVITKKRILNEHAKYQKNEDTLTAALAAQGVKRSPIDVTCHCGWVHLSLGGGCTRPTPESLIACGFPVED